MQTRTALAFSSLLLAAACAHLPPPTVPSSFSAGEVRVADQLMVPLTPDTLDVANQPLESVLRDIAKHNNVNIVVNWTALAVAGVEKSTPISIQLHGVSLGDALSNILNQMNATMPLICAPSNSVLTISTKSALAADTCAHYVRLRYDVADLLAAPAVTGTTDNNRRMAYLIDLIITQIAPTTWHIVQYPDTLLAPLAFTIPPNPRTYSGEDVIEPRSIMGSTTITNEAATGKGIISAFNSSLIITQTPEIQEEIGKLITQLRGK